MTGSPCFQYVLFPVYFMAKTGVMEGKWIQSHEYVLTLGCQAHKEGTQVLRKSNLILTHVQN